MAERKPCVVCGATEGPTAFVGDPYCCDDHRKAMPPLVEVKAGSIGRADLSGLYLSTKATGGW